MNPAHRIGIAGPQTVFVIVRQELGLIRRHVDVDGAIAFASLAGQAQVKRVEHLLALPAVADHIAVHHLEEKMGAPARRVFFLHRRAVTGAHRALFLTPAFSDADTAHRGMRETALVMNEVEMRCGFFRREVRSETQILRDRDKGRRSCPDSFFLPGPITI